MGTKLDMALVRESGQHTPERIAALQVAVFVAAGGGLLGRLAAEEPADFYVDARCGRLPYGRRELAQAVEVLATLAEKAGMDPHAMPPMPLFHNAGLF